MTTATERHVMHENEAQRASHQCTGPHECGLERLQRPVFHPGQLLTAEALRLGQEYVEQRMNLRRFVDGVGVVCGLNVRCHPGEPGHVIIEPGYAIDCCGNDLVVPEPLCVDICGRISGDVTSIGSGYDDGVEASPAAQEARYTVRVESAPLGSAPVPVVVGRGDGERESECRDSKQILDVSVCVEPARKASVDDGEPNRVKRFRAIADEVTCSVGRQLSEVAARREGTPSDDETGVALADALLLALRHQPPSTLCNLEDVVRKQREILKEKRSGEPIDSQAADILVRVLAGLMDDRRESYLAQQCEECCDRTGVALADVLVDWRIGECVGETCQLTAIDTQPPAREALHPRSTWWRGDEVNVYDAYFTGAREACTMLAARGLRVDVRGVHGRSLDKEQEFGDLPGRCIDADAGRQLDEILYPWLRDYGAEAELRRLALYRRSELYVPCGTAVTLWTVCARVVSIEIADLGGANAGYAGSSGRAFGEYVRYTSGREGWWGRLYMPRAPRSAPDPLDEAIDGIGPDTEKALFLGGLWTLEQLVAVQYEVINDLVSPVLLNFRPQTFEGWKDQALKILNNPRAVSSLHKEHGDDAGKRLTTWRREA